MNGDLISRSALLADIEESVVFSVKNGQPSAEIRGANKITDRIKAAAAVDAVEVVRCRDCKHSRERNEYERVYLVDGVLICTNPDCTDDCWQAVWPDHWCKCGERRADDGSNY